MLKRHILFLEFFFGLAALHCMLPCKKRIFYLKFMQVTAMLSFNVMGVISTYFIFNVSDDKSRFTHQNTIVFILNNMCYHILNVLSVYGIIANSSSWRKLISVLYFIDKNVKYDVSSIFRLFKLIGYFCTFGLTWIVLIYVYYSSNVTNWFYIAYTVFNANKIIIIDILTVELTRYMSLKLVFLCKKIQLLFLQKNNWETKISSITVMYRKLHCAVIHFNKVFSNLILLRMIIQFLECVITFIVLLFESSYISQNDGVIYKLMSLFYILSHLVSYFSNIFF